MWKQPQFENWDSKEQCGSAHHGQGDLDKKTLQDLRSELYSSLGLDVFILSLAACQQSLGKLVDWNSQTKYEMMPNPEKCLLPLTRGLAC